MVHKLPQHYTCLRITETTPLKIEFTHFRGPHREDMFERRRHCPDRSNIPQGRHMRDSQGRHIRAVEGQHAACYWSNSAVQQPFSQHSNPVVPRPCVHAGSTTSSLTAMRPRRVDYNKHTVPRFFLIYSSTDLSFPFTFLSSSVLTLELVVVAFFFFSSSPFFSPSIQLCIRYLSFIFHFPCFSLPYPIFDISRTFLTSFSSIFSSFSSFILRLSSHWPFFFALRSIFLYFSSVTLFTLL